MKHTVVTVLVFALIAIAADAIHAALGNALYEQFAAGTQSAAGGWLARNHNYLFVSVFCYAVVFAAAGASIARRFARPIHAHLAALLLGLSVVLSDFVLMPVRPFFYSTHAAPWLALLFWANWYVPPMASLLGGIVSHRIFQKRSGYGKHAA